MRTVEIQIQKLPHAADLPLPKYESTLAAGMDLRAAIEHSVQLLPGERRLIPSGIAIALPSGYEAQVRPRSGLALKHGITCLNSPGTVDADYRGEIRVLLINLGQETAIISRGDRIAQMIVAPVCQGTWIEVSNLDQTERGSDGFGSSGVS